MKIKMKAQAGEKIWLYSKGKLQQIQIIGYSAIGMYYFDEEGKEALVNYLDFGFYRRYGRRKEKMFFLKYKYFLPLAIILDPLLLVWVNRFHLITQMRRKIKNFICNKLL